MFSLVFAGVLLVIDACNMSEIGRAYVPISVPFGFHNRFFSSLELGLPEGVVHEVLSHLHHRPTNETNSTVRLFDFS